MTEPQTARIAFLTMVWRDYWLLEKWVAHNAKLVGKRNLYVVNHGGDPKIDKIASGCNVLHVPRDEVTIDLTRKRWRLVGNITNGLQAFYDLVVCTDVDEFLVYTGTGPGLVAHLSSKATDADALSPLGLNIIPTEKDGDDPDMPVLGRHRHALLSAKYTKPCITRRPVSYTIGGHGLIKGRFEIDPDIVLFHLHYVTPDYAERMAARQQIVADAKQANKEAEAPMDVPGRFWINWSKPQMVRNKEMGLLERSTVLDLSGGFDQAAAILRGAVTSVGKRTVVDPDAMAGGPYSVLIPKTLQDAI